MPSASSRAMRSASTPRISEFKSNGIPAIAIGGCAQDPTDAAFCLATDVYQSAYLGTKALIEAMGGKGAIVHLAGLLVDPNTTLARHRRSKRPLPKPMAPSRCCRRSAIPTTRKQGDQKVNALLAAQKDKIGGIIATGYISSVVAATALQEPRRQAHQAGRHR